MPVGAEERPESLRLGTDRPGSRSLPGLIAGLLASGLATLVMVSSHILPLGGVPEEGGDYGFMTWNLWFVNESLSHGRNPYWTRLIYYPVGTWLSKHTLAAGFFPLAFVTKLVSGGSPLYPVYAYRLAILLCFSLSTLLAYRLLVRLGLLPWASAPFALAYGFCRFNHLHIPHIHHLAGAVLLPGCSLAVLSLVERPRRGLALLLAAILAGGVYLTEFIVFVYIGLALAALVAVALPSLRGVVSATLRGLGLRTLLLGALVYTLLLAPFLAAWIRDAAQPPKERQAAVSSANLAGFVVPDPEFTPLYGQVFAPWTSRVRRGVSGRETFLGFPLLLFAVVGLLCRKPPSVRLAALVAFGFLVLSLGPELKVLEENTEWPLPYELLRRVPPFEMARTPVRFVLPALFGLAIVAAHGLSRTLRGVERRAGRAAAAGVAALMLLWCGREAYLPGPRAATYAPPPELASLVPGAVINVPISAWDGYAEFLQTFHGRPIATGFVSRGEKEPTDHVKELDRLLETDPPAFAAHLAREGVTNLILGPAAPRATVERVRHLPLHVVNLSTYP